MGHMPNIVSRCYLIEVFTVNSVQTKEAVLILIFSIVAVASGADLLADFFHGVFHAGGLLIEE